MVERVIDFNGFEGFAIKREPFSIGQLVMIEITPSIRPTLCSS